MRIFPILASIALAVILYMAILERPTLLGYFGVESSGEEGAVVNATETAGDTVTDHRVKVVTERRMSQNIDSAVLLRGQTAAARQVAVLSETSAIVISEPLRKGAQIEKGQVLCKLDEGTRGASLALALAQLSEARYRVPEAEARVQEASALLEEARINQNASSRLNEGGFASTTRVASSDAAVAAAEAGVSTAQSGLSAAHSGIEAAQAAVQTAETELDRLVIKAPFSGLLESDTAELGSLLQPGALCATIIQLDPVKLEGFVPETEVNRIQVGAKAGARLAAGGGDVQGTVTFLSRSADPQTRTFSVEIEVPNPDLKIRDGQTAEILIASDGAKAHLVPQSALTLNDEGTLGLRLVDADNIVSFHAVELVRDTTKGVWVTGLPEVADIIVVGQEYVIAGVEVLPTQREVSQ
ncbi:efflux RND transporter periplasmic adaptor subunit [Sulfitobacter donghicola]|uniref:Hemolysin D n=1 Tax=Sulfitobacter donghicola DSW-25 = KCTC 12864 = JCM 14565 TaxID=1300350 RepID=A0A073IKT4_9RHOB|nr:efflux RND transporter periplasmic adaptor subunit [Sulfitobacter donghicola]KEJ90096.1 hemolysin D [Sulfitobacter donghicola DSW-25 = KCTC 12864 = JCM 14565]KIN66752.1 Efflux transporter, RND family, MFP subunit [Sulfitobacter donghicola DSW-25 = KCTC 12864 = JCM 14565]